MTDEGTPGGSDPHSVTPDLRDWLSDVCADYRWAGRRGLDLAQPGLEHRSLVGSYQLASVDPDARTLVVQGRTRPAAATIMRPKPMESSAFRIKTAELSHVVCAPETVDRHDVVRELLGRSLAAAADHEVELVVLRVDAEDVQTLDAAQRVGFAVHECTLTWLADSQEDSLADPSIDVSVETYEGGVRQALPRDVLEHLSAKTAGWQMSHFGADPRLPPEAVERYYGQWMHNIAAGTWSDCLFVARHRGRIVGLESEVSDRALLAETGVTIRNGEWIVVLEPGLGAGRALMSAAGRHRYPGGRFHQWETQARNAPIIRCIEQTGARPIRSAYTLHAWPRSA